ncbi:hypothetical protein [Longitalea arenae]|uniref:hypothetical protein n=1 Tax=Longitalea arenae TaxID=2812558 RepID=UPI001966D404|nr:hypothetical protein [Longitalea arenae]
MSSFSITQLEVARRDPAAFAKIISSSKEDTPSFNRYPQSMRWLNAISKYHDTNDIDSAINYIENWFDKRKDNSVNRRALRKWILSLGKYEETITAKGYNLVNSRESINIEMRSIRIGGVIPVIFMKPSEGFAAYFVSKPNSIWEKELKYPVIQNYLSTSVFNTDQANIDVGYIDFTTGDFYEICYNKKQIKEAKDELTNITNIIIDNL